MTEQPDDQIDDAEGVPDWTWLMQIGAHGVPDHKPDATELGLEEVRRICWRAWHYSRSVFEPDSFVELKRSQWRETGALAGSMSESIMLASAAYTEAVWHERAIAGGESARMALAQRYLAETAIDSAVAVGHRLINFVARVARTSTEVQPAMGAKFEGLGPDYVPFDAEADQRGAWLSLNSDEVKKLRRALNASGHTDIHRGALDALKVLAASEEWKELVKIRAENFHRWRKEHESTMGVDGQSGPATDIYRGGTHVGRSFGVRGRKHRIADGLTERTTSAAGSGIRHLAVALDEVITSTLEAIPQLHPGHSIEISANGTKVTRKFL